MRVARRILILALALASLGAMAAPAESLQIERYRVEGATLWVTVAASGDAAQEASLFAAVATAAGLVELTADVGLEPGETRTVALEATAEILGVIVLGAVVDDGSPF